MLNNEQLCSKWNLGELLEQKKAAEERSKSIKKLVDALKADMLDNGVKDLENNGVHAVVTQTEKVDMDEEKLTEMLVELAERGDQVARGCLKAVLTVDVDALEQAVYHNRIDKTIITKATTSKTVTQIRITKLKDKK